MRFCARAILQMLLAGITAAAARPATAEDCKSLQLVNSVKLESSEKTNGFLVPVEINGVPQKLVLDTGGATTSLSPQAVKALGLQDENSKIKLYDLYGNVASSQVTVKTFDMGNARGENLKFQVSPMQNLETGLGANGLLSTDLFLQYDIDLDFSAKRLNYFSQDHCQGKVVYWQERPVAVIPITPSNGHIIVPVTIDGQQVQATIDTGAGSSVMNVEAAFRTFGINAGSDDAPLVETSKTDPLMKVYSHKFGTLSFEGVSVSNPNINIIADRMGANEFKSSLRGTTSDPYNSRLRQIIIGMDVLRRLHLYVAYKEQKLYISPAGTGESVLFNSAAPAP